MKRIFFIVAILSTAFVQNSFAQDSTRIQPAQLLHSYYDIKNALVAGNANTASLKAEEFVKTLNGVDPKIINEATRDTLLKDAGHISESKDIKHQREHFATFSTNMYALAKAVKLTTEPVYYAWCPMKKAYWLSSDKAIKNPYFGSAMLTCGKITETLQ
jgi:Protein of unknown function (DUF3347)